jgi:tetratricopeptide (TPR) repeat protein
MEIKEPPAVSRRDIEAKIANVGDYVKMDFLSAALKKNLDFDARKFALTKLASIYESRNMFIEAAKLMRASADINTTFDAKVNEFVKSAELFIKGGSFDEADVSFTKAIAAGNQRQKEEVKAKRKTLYKAQALDYMKKDKRTYAMKAYEKLLTLDFMHSEKAEIQKTLLSLYEKLGKVREFYALKRAIENPSSVQQKPQQSQPQQKKFLPDPSIDELLGAF